MKVSTGEIPPEYVTLLRKNGMAEQEIAVYERKYRELIAQYGEKYWSYDCGATYKGYLKFYIDKIRARGAVPVLVTPPPRQYYKNGKIAAVAGQHGGEDAFGAFPYVRAIRQLGRQEKCCCTGFVSKKFGIAGAAWRKRRQKVFKALKIKRA